MINDSWHEHVSNNLIIVYYVNELNNIFIFLFSTFQSQQHPGDYQGGGLQGPPPMGYAPPGQSSRYPAVNGGPPSQTMNGLPDTSGPGRPPQSRYPPMPV